MDKLIAMGKKRDLQDSSSKKILEIREKMKQEVKKEKEEANKNI